MLNAFRDADTLKDVSQHSNCVCDSELDGLGFERRWDRGSEIQPAF